MNCRLVSARLPSVGPGESLGDALDEHVAECLRCQAEGARYRRLNRALSGLATTVVPAPAGFAASVEFALDHADGAVATGPWRRGRVAAATGAVAAAAGIVAVAVWRRTHHAA